MANSAKPAMEAAPSPQTMLQRLVANWVYGGFLAGILLLLLTPFFAQHWTPWLTSVFLCLPIYMLHQYEEHDHDRFRLYVNQVLGQGREALTPADVFVINVPGVWLVVAISWILALRLNPGFGLIAIYLVLVNALAHLAASLVTRKYNPGLITAIVFFLPLSLYALRCARQSGSTTLGMHLTGLAISLGIHLAIVVHARLRLRRLGI